MTTKVKELADAEAERAEAEPPDTEEPTPQEDEPVEGEDEDIAPGEPPQPEPSAEEQVKQLEGALRRFEKAMAKALNVEPPLDPVPMDGAVGFMFPGAMELRTHDRFHICTTCNGFGKVLTGSHNPEHSTRDCPDTRCSGRGYWEKSAPPPMGTATASVPANGRQDEYVTPSYLGDTNITPQAPVFNPTPVPGR
jgi:hypothetical protein